MGRTAERLKADEIRRSPKTEAAEKTYDHKIKISLKLQLFLFIHWFLVCFLAVIKFVNSPYNQRQDSFAPIWEKQIEMAMNMEKTETRTYPYGSLFSHVIGYYDSQFGKTGLDPANFDTSFYGKGQK